MLLKRLFIYLLLILSYTSLYSASDELQNANWVFGEGVWIDFSSGTPISKNGAKISAPEGAAAISDRDGNLLFYTDGRTLYNNKHQMIENGNYLYGDVSSSQSSIIIPNPNNEDLYYVFTADELWDYNSYEKSGHQGFNYSIVDISKNNGLGKVISKNINLFKRTCEKVAAIGNKITINDKVINNNYWVIAQEWETNSLKVYMVDDKGVKLVHTYKSNIFSFINHCSRTMAIG